LVMSSNSPQAKKAKTSPQSPSLEEITATAWEHYRNYIDTCDNSEEGEGDTDELEEMITEVLLKPHSNINSMLKPLATLTDLSPASISTQALIPVLISVGYLHMADVAISECLEYQQDQQEEQTKEQTKGERGNKNVAATVVGNKQELIQKCQHCIQESLKWYPENAAMWSMGANFGRMLQVIDPATICQWYERAVESAVKVRTTSLQLLDDETCPTEVKEWLELLLLNQVSGVEYVVDDDDEEKDLPDEDDGSFSSSAVEAMGRFMAAMLQSAAGRHASVLTHLRHFPVTHRVHPSVWQPPNLDQNASTPPPPAAAPAPAPAAIKSEACPVKYRCTDANEGILPTSTYRRLCQVFAPNAPYWIESDYNHRGYYSYYMDKPDAIDATAKDFVPANLLEDVIWSHLYPLVKEQVAAQCTAENVITDICGAEWWVHTRPIEANLGHNLHFDTDEALLVQEKAITHPLFSSVMYLTGGSKAHHEGGATIVFDQTPDSETVASKVWRCIPDDNSYLVFPGNMLHGVLPCPGSKSVHTTTEEEDASSSSATSSVDKQWIAPSMSEDGTHRLTFLVGFWTRRVPDKMKNRRLYGPCGPLPPRSTAETKDYHGKKHTWVDELYEGYGTDPSATVTPHSSQSSVCRELVPCISPAWESIIVSQDVSNDEHTAIQQQRQEEEVEDKLQIPTAIDHRFFVRDPPKCFRDSLFEKNNAEEEEDGMEGDDDDEE